MADYKVPYFLKRIGESLIFNQDGEFIFYVPEIYFSRGDAIIVGEYVNMIGICDYAIADENGRIVTRKRFNFPTVFLTQPYDMVKQKKTKVGESTTEDDYRLLKYRKGDVIVVSTSVPQSIENVEDFYKLFAVTGHIPTTIPYDELQNYFIESMELNGSSYGMTIQMFGMLISELCRSKDDPSMPFRLSGKTNMHDYNAISIKEVPKYIGSYSSFTSENWDHAIAGSIVNKTNLSSPMEKLLMGEAATDL